MSAAQLRRALFQGDAAHLLRQGEIEPHEPPVLRQRPARGQQDVGAAHVQLGPDVAAHQPPPLPAALGGPVLGGDVLVAEEVEHAENALAGGGHPDGVHPALHRAHRPLPFPLYRQLAGIKPRHLAVGRLRAEVEGRPRHGLAEGAGSHRVVHLKGRGAGHIVPAGGVVGGGHQGGGGVLVHPHRHKAVKAHRRPAWGLPAEGEAALPAFVHQQLKGGVAAPGRVQPRCLRAGEGAVRIKPGAVVVYAEIHCA